MWQFEAGWFVEPWINAGRFENLGEVSEKARIYFATR
jgi:hypothetical protein